MGNDTSSRSGLFLYDEVGGEVQGQPNPATKLCSHYECGLARGRREEAERPTSPKAWAIGFQALVSLCGVMQGVNCAPSPPNTYIISATSVKTKGNKMERPPLPEGQAPSSTTGCCCGSDKGTWVSAEGPWYSQAGHPGFFPDETKNKD